LKRLFRIFLIIALVFSFSPSGHGFDRAKAASEVTINVSDIALPTSFSGVGTNVDATNDLFGHGSFFAANLITNPSFEDRWYPAQTATNNSTDGYDLHEGFSQPWFATTDSWHHLQLVGSGVTGSLDTTNKKSGNTSQKVSLPANFTEPIALMKYPGNIPFNANHLYTAKAQIKSSQGGTVKIRILGPGADVTSPAVALTAGADFKEISYSFRISNVTNPLFTQARLVFTPTSTNPSSFWADDFILWDTEGTTTNGLDQRGVDELKAMKPPVLRWGSLAGNELTLARETFRPWPSTYGPQPDFDIASFLDLAGAVGAKALVTIPPSFNSDDYRTNHLQQLIDARTAAEGTSPKCSDPTKNAVLAAQVDILENSFDEHLQLLDYLATLDLSKVPHIYFELGNEMWNSMTDPYFLWDCTYIDQNYGAYVVNRVKAMKNSSKWKSGFYEIGFGGHWANEGFDDNVAQVVKNANLASGKSIDFFTETGYVPWMSGMTNFQDLSSEFSRYYSALMASGTERAGKYISRRASVNSAAGLNLKMLIYESSSEVPGIQNGGSLDNPNWQAIPHSLGSTVALIDLYAKMQEAGIEDINYYTATGTNPTYVYGFMTGYGDYQKRVPYYGMKMLNMLPQTRLQADTQGSPTWNDSTLSQSNIKLVEGYGYKTSDNNNYYALIINRDQTSSHSVTLNFPAGKSYSFSAAISTLNSSNSPRSINDNNDSMADVVTLSTTSVPVSGSSYSFTTNPYSATIIHFAVGTGASLKLTKSVDKIISSSGQNLTYTIEYQNDGTVAVTNAVVSDNIPSGTTFISATNNGASDGTKITWNSGNLAVGATGTVNFQVRIQ